MSLFTLSHSCTLGVTSGVLAVRSCCFSIWIIVGRLATYIAHTKPNRTVEYMICIPAHTAIIGAWFGAWPMPLDWEKPWQEWPICVSYGAMVGYLVGIVASLGLALVRDRQQHHKGD
ncbi:hypothetical protein LWI29_032350 [Acer saccharum]|uniref:Phosphatidylinositol-glycan biosynthesis class F protein n=1 Tax=Acer saccharum TaxID=4024 RepID=A0AA39SY62_ACESA|nr:hypothetical protein LWI29_032350 [Acer saccharum]